MKIVYLCEFEGVPVYNAPKYPSVAHSRGIWPWKKIVLGEGWPTLSHEEKVAVLLHELYHVRLFHVERRVLMLPFLWMRWAQERAAAHEFACDAFVAEQGYGIALIRLLRRMHGDDPEGWYPPPGERIVRLMKEIDRCNHAA